MLLIIISGGCAAGGGCGCASCALLACPSIRHLQKPADPIHGGGNCSVRVVPVQESQGGSVNPLGFHKQMLKTATNMLSIIRAAQ